MKIDKDELKRKAANAKEKAARKAKDARAWCRANRDLLVVAIPAGATVASAGMKMHSKHVAKANLRKEKELQERYVYDRSLGMYHKLRKPLTSAQAIEIEKRRADGEKMAMILRSMKLI